MELPDLAALPLDLITHALDFAPDELDVRHPSWFPGSQTCCQCGQIHREMRKLSVRRMVCDCGNVMGRDRNAAVNHHSYSEEPRKRATSPLRAWRLEIRSLLRCRSLKREYWRMWSVPESCESRR